MADAGTRFHLEAKSKKIAGELDENNDLTSIEASTEKYRVGFMRKISKKELDKRNHHTTGIPQLATVAPNPLDREDLIDKEFSHKAISVKPWFSALVTIAAILFDLFCYLQIMESLLDVEQDRSASLYFAAIAAAAAIDIIPVYSARIMHVAKIKAKAVVLLFFAISTIFIGLFIAVFLGVRLEYFSRTYGLVDPGEDIVVLQSLIPIATTLICFIVNYFSYDPFEKKIKTLRKVEAFREENIHELEALLVEIKSEPDYPTRLKEEDDTQFAKALDQIDAIADLEKTKMRSILMLNAVSPADISDLAVKSY